MMHRHVHGGKCHAPLRSSLVILATRDHGRCYLRSTSVHSCTSTGIATSGPEVRGVLQQVFLCWCVFSKECHGEGGVVRNSEDEPFMARVVMRRAAASDRTSTAFPCTWTTHALAERLPRSLEPDVTKEPASVLQTVRCNILKVS